MTDIEAVRGIGLADISLQNEIGNGGFVENVPLPTSCLSFNKCLSSAKWHNILMTLQNASIGSSRVLDEDVATVLKEAIACADNDIQWNGSGIIELLKRAVDLAENGNIEGSRKAAVSLLDFHKMVEKYREVMVRQPSITDNSDTTQFGFPEIPLDSIESNKRRPVNLGSTGSLLSRSLSLSVSNDCKQLASVRDNFGSQHGMGHSTLPYSDEFHEVKHNYSKDVLPSNSGTSHVDNNLQVNQENKCGNSCDILGCTYDASYMDDKIVTKSLSEIPMDNVVPSTHPLGLHRVSFDVSLSGTDASNKPCDTSFESGFNNHKKMPAEFHFFDAMNVLSEVCAHASSDDEIEELDRGDAKIADFDFRTRQASVNESSSYGQASTCTSPNALTAPTSCSEELISNVSSISSQSRMTTVTDFERSSLLTSPLILSSKSLTSNAVAPPSRSDSFQFRVPPPIHTISRPKIVHSSPPPSLSSSAPRHLTSNGMNRSSNLHSPIQFQNQIRNQIQPHSHKTPQLSQVSRYSVHSSTVATRRWTGHLLSYASSLLANSSPYPSFSKGLSCPVIVGRTVPYCELSMEVPVEHCECLGTALPVSRISSRHGVKLTRHFACKCQISFTCMEQMEKLKRMAAQELVFFCCFRQSRRDGYRGK
uniref:Uncharacterized protein n=1 Tax=Polytomella parva TaxID=51329 RepID=A0A7S0YM92_9CHLO|mmetsp:Transcript_33043/g.59773  ORF Transcript_33043/g.59773 Transcript_33043/m.59773 type:complete len:649 (+) Transcript_33043:77-2023(+)